SLFQKLILKTKGRRRLKRRMKLKVQEEWEAEEERNKIAEEQATNEALIQDFSNPLMVYNLPKIDKDVADIAEKMLLT
ncbi:hypothetical protein Tco_0742767, partial [Tanacetum coccineum]